MMILNQNSNYNLAMKYGMKSADNDVDTIFNNFLATYLRAFCHCFPLKKCNKMKKMNNWITNGIKISSTHKRDLYLLSRSSNNRIIKNHYKKYFQVYQMSLKQLRDFTVITKLLILLIK
jgi:hypothetical protein